MATNTEPEFVEATLQWCNERRKEKDMEPLDKLPLGERGKGASCPCGKATGLYVGTLYYWDPNDPDKRHRPLPDLVNLFTLAFDRGELPQYDLYPNTI